MMRSLKRAEASAAGAGGEPPALLTTTSSRWWTAAMVRTSASTASASRTSQATNFTLPRSPGSLRPAATTVAPAAAKRSLMARPMLRVPPVTSTTLPVKSRGSACRSVAIGDEASQTRAGERTDS